MSVRTVNSPGIAGYNSRGIGSANSAKPLTGTPFHLDPGQSITGKGVVTFCTGNVTLDGVTIGNMGSGGNAQGNLPWLRFSASASCVGKMSGLLLASVPDILAIPTRSTAPNVYSNNTSYFEGNNNGGTSDQTFTAVNVGSGMAVCTGFDFSSSHSGVDSNYPPNFSWYWWLYVNSSQTNNTDLEIWYGAHSTGSYSRYDTNATVGLFIPFSGTLKVRARTDVSGSCSVGAAFTVRTYAL